MLKRTLACAALFLALVVLIPSSASAAEEGVFERYETMPFQPGTLVIPMDAGQKDVLSAFGFVHSLLRNGTAVQRIITPPDLWLVTEARPDGANFSGGPFVISEPNSTAINAVHALFPDVTVDATKETFVSTRVYSILGPTKVLLIKPWSEYSRHGRTELLLDSLRIPYAIRTTLEIDLRPDTMLDYDLIIDDDVGWDGTMSAKTTSMMRTAAFGGKNIIYTDKAMKDSAIAFPKMVTVVPGSLGAFDCRFVPHEESPAQYSGPENISIRSSTNHIDPWIIRRPVSAKVRVLIDCEDYGGDYRIMAAYFAYGKGSVEMLAYHPEDQSGLSYILTSVFYGNRFIQAPPAPVKAMMPPAPDGSGMPLPAALPPPPPPPPPPPGLPVATAIPAQYLFAGFAGIIMADRLRSRVRPKIALRQKHVVSA
ncbi:MAG: hypothetical protein HZB92_01575 [Euryarchaeota archaeon]|nr:hypothetical protein [Euryarchaeota archaeon]